MTDISHLGTFELIKSTLEYSVNAWNPRFMDKLYAGTNPIGVISELLMAVLNSNTHVYHVSPVLTLMEIEVTKAVGKLLNKGEVNVLSVEAVKGEKGKEKLIEINIEFRWIIMPRWLSFEFIGNDYSTQQIISKH